MAEVHICSKAPEIGIIQEKVNNMELRMTKYEQTQDILMKLSESVAVMISEVKHVGINVGEVKNEMTSLKANIATIKENQNVLEVKQDRKDAGTWNEVKKYIMFAILGGVITVLITLWRLDYGI